MNHLPKPDGKTSPSAREAECGRMIPTHLLTRDLAQIECETCGLVHRLRRGNVDLMETLDRIRRICDPDEAECYPYECYDEFVRDLSSEIARLREERDSWRRTCEKITEERDEARARLDRGEKWAKAFRDDRDRAIEQRDEARKQLRAFEHEVMTGRDEQHQRLVAERDSLASRVEALEGALRDLVGGETDCRLDHEGFCQEHALGRPCAVKSARALLAGGKDRKEP